MGIFNLALLASFVVGILASTIPEKTNQEIDNKEFFGIGKKWVVLVSGSDGWRNYRHQADICHAYHLMIENGIPTENIITMMVDDIAYNYNNPTQGVIINWPNGTDVYKGVPIDYTGSDVNPDNFLSIIKGVKSNITGEANTGRVVESGPFDKIFINFVDHGSPGLLAFPEEYLYADELNDALSYMYENNLYSKVLLYIEACESGSMFDGILREDTKVLAVTAAGPRESSWACYCGQKSKPYNTCLGDVFSVTWMENLDATLDTAFLKKRNVFNDFATVRTEVKRSNVMVYGDFKVGHEKLSSFIGYRQSQMSQLTRPKSGKFNFKDSISSRDVEESVIEYRLQNEKEMPIEERQKLEKEKQTNKKMRLIIDNVFLGIYSLVVMERPEIKNIIGSFDEPISLDLSLDMFQCYRSIINKINKSCFSLPRNPYSLKWLRILANICVVDNNIDKSVDRFVTKFCSTIPKEIINIF